MAKKPAANSAPVPQKGKLPQRAASQIDTDLIRAIAQLLTETNVGEIEVAKGDLKVRVSRHGGVMMQPQMMQPQIQAAHAVVAPAAMAPAEKAAPAKAADASQHPGAVKSPMVGTAYRKPSPDAVNFVEVGASVKAGQKLMLIEAMKTFNDITSPTTGTVTAIFVEDGQPVEFGQTLFVIE